MRPRLLGVIVVVLAALGGSVAPLWAANDDLRLPAPTFPVASELHDANQSTEALAVLDRQLEGLTGDALPAEAQILRATLLTAVGRHQQSEALWDEVAQRDRSLVVFATRAVVMSLAGRGEPAQAEMRLSELTRATSTRQHMDLILRVAEAQLSAGAFSEAAALYGRVLRSQRRGTFADAARLGLAAAQELTGDLDGAVRTFREAQLQHRAPEAFRDARAGEQRVSGALGRTPQGFAEDQYLTLARRMRTASQYEASRELLEAWRRRYPETPRVDVIEAEIIDTLYNMRANDEAATRCLQFLERFPASPLLARVRLTQFRLDVRMNRLAAVRSRGDDLWHGRVEGATADGRRSTGELLAAYLVSMGDVEAGLEVYEELVRTAPTDSDRRDMLWRAGVAALRVRQDERAVSALRELNRRNPIGELLPAALYWLGVAEHRVGRPAEASRRFRTLEQRYTHHYYGLLASERLADLAAASASPDPEERRPNSSLQFPALELGNRIRRHPDFAAATLLAKAGLMSEAADHTRRLLDRNRRNRALALLAARASADAGDYRRVSLVLVNHFVEYLYQRATDLPEDFWQLVYPRPFWEEIQASADANDADPFLLLSLMRQESRFDPRARSPVGAVGLFQIMPYTAAALGPQAGVGALDGSNAAGELLKPSVNVAIAATLLSNLTTMFGDAIPPVIASYNAGEDLVSVWWQAATGLAEDQFVDSIPYRQTRQFTREVLANYSAYRRLYQGVQ